MNDKYSWETVKVPWYGVIFITVWWLTMLMLGGLFWWLVIVAAMQLYAT